MVRISESVHTMIDDTADLNLQHDSSINLRFDMTEAFVGSFLRTILGNRSYFAIKYRMTGPVGE